MPYRSAFVEAEWVLVMTAAAFVWIAACIVMIRTLNGAGRPRPAVEWHMWAPLVAFVYASILVVPVVVAGMIVATLAAHFFSGQLASLAGVAFALVMAAGALVVFRRWTK